MSYMTMEEQVQSHLTFLKNEQMDVEELFIDKGFIRCDITGEPRGRGELCYQTKKTLLRNGLIGLATWLRAKGGEVKTHKTYGPPNPEESQYKESVGISPAINSEAVRKAKLFWEMSERIGESEYLLKKGVGYYGIRFRKTGYGKVAVIPMGDAASKIVSYQIINEDGSKKFARDVGITGLFHMLHQPIDGLPIGLAESYVTAASCFEITGMAMVTAFSGENLKPVGLYLRKHFPKSRLIIFADNDRHLPENKGRRVAIGTQEALGKECDVVIPDFKEYPISREYSDWNDYVRENGVKAAREAMRLLKKGEA